MLGNDRNKYIIGILIGYLISSMVSTIYSVSEGFTPTISTKTQTEMFNETTSTKTQTEMLNETIAEALSSTERDEAKRLETAVIMVTGLLPSHPSIWVVEKALDSMWSNLQGLPPRTNIYITVDAPKDLDKEKLEILDQYTQALHRRFSEEENRHVKIIVNSVNRHVNGSLKKVVFDLIDTNTTKYVYVLQHDLIFMPGKIINHTALVDTFDKYYEKEIVRLVGFAKDYNRKPIRSGVANCTSRADLGLENPMKIYEGSNKTIYLTHSGYWSDQNHFTTVEYYRDILTMIGPTPRFPENPMKNAAKKDCRLYGTHWYGLPNDGRYICHLDSKEAYNAGICPKDFWEQE